MSSHEEAPNAVHPEAEAPRDLVMENFRKLHTLHKEKQAELSQSQIENERIMQKLEEVRIKNEQRREEDMRREAELIRAAEIRVAHVPIIATWLH